MNEMQNALAAGREITVHQSPITQSGWTGSGYIITDPATGAGAYKISGGANGAALYIIAALFIALIIPLIVYLAGATLVVTSLVLVGTGVNLYSLNSSLDKIFNDTNLSQETQTGLIKFVSFMSIISSLANLFKVAGMDTSTVTLVAIDVSQAASSLLTTIMLYIGKLFNSNGV
jgi:hypothetical protein